MGPRLHRQWDTAVSRRKVILVPEGWVGWVGWVLMGALSGPLDIVWPLESGIWIGF